MAATTIIETHEPVYTKVCILDFEATCPPKGSKSEIIEIGSIMYEYKEDAENWVEVDRFQTYCRPLLNPQLTPFCRGLTKITQKQVDMGLPFYAALENHYQWLQQHGTDIPIITCGNTDMEYMLPNTISLYNMQLPTMYSQFINLQLEFWLRYDISVDGLPGLSRMLKMCQMTFEGRHHGALMDCHNLGRLLRLMTLDGFKVEKANHIPCGQHRHIVRKLRAQQ